MPDEEPGAGHLVQLLQRQGRACGALGSPLYAGLLSRAAEDVLAGGPTALVLAGHEGDPEDAALPLRLLGAVHRLVLEGGAPGLAPYYPSAGGSPDAGDPWPGFAAVLREHAAEVRRGLGQAPQTNEVGRAGALIGGLLHVAARTGLPVRLVELGASAGLNLRADAFRILAGDGTAWGPPDSPVVLQGAWEGSPLPPVDAPLRVVERVGVDVAPLDPTTRDGELTLLSYVWPDQPARVQRLRGAIELARRMPAPVVRASAREFLARLELRPGAVTVLWHSIVWQYLSGEEQAISGEQVRRLAEQASPDSPFAHLALEPRPTADGEQKFLVSLALHPGAGERVLAVAHPHGLPTRWTAGA